MTTWRRPRSVTTLAAAAAACLATALAAGTAWRLRPRVSIVEVAGESMTPALQSGDFLLVRAGPPPRGRAYGQIVLTEDPRPEGEQRLLLKRIVGLPGEMLRVGGGVQVNGRRLLEPYAHGAAPAAQYRGVQRVADDAYFLLGDHRGASTDSRDFGAVPRERIAGTAFLRYWPPERLGWLRPPARRLLAPAERLEPTEDAGSS